MLDKIRFNDKEYITRDILLSDYEVVVKVSSDDLDHALYADDNGYASREAELIDELIYCYVPAQMISASDKDLEQYIIEMVYGDQLL